MATFAQDNLTGTNNEGSDANNPLRYLTASSMMGDAVKNEQGESMGTIKDIMLDITTGSIRYYIIEFGGFLGVGTKYFAIPFGILIVNPEEKSFVFNQKKEMLENAPGFDFNHWPDTNNHLDRVYEYWSFV